MCMCIAGEAYQRCLAIVQCMVATTIVRGRMVKTLNILHSRKTPLSDKCGLKDAVEQMQSIPSMQEYDLHTLPKRTTSMI